jgi:hypothetical protein
LGVRIITIVGIYLCVLYIRWHYAIERLKAYHHLEERRRKVTNINPTADATPIMYGHIESSPKTIDVRYSITTPASMLKAMFLRVSAMSFIVRKVIKGKMRCQSIKSRISSYLTVLREPADTRCRHEMGSNNTELCATRVFSNSEADWSALRENRVISRLQRLNQEQRQ